MDLDVQSILGKNKKTSKVEFRVPDSAARKAFRGHGRIQGAMEDASMVHNRHQSTLWHTCG